MTDFLSSLNDKQQEAVQTTSGPLLVIAGAGSGKTRALTHRIAYLIREKGVSPWNILAVTFTNKAAGEMKERLVDLLNIRPRNTSENSARDVFESPDLPTVGTFHAVCVRILRKHLHLLDFENSFTIYDTADQVILMRRLMKEYGFDEKELNPKAVLSHISRAKNNLITAEKFQSMIDSYFAGKVAQLYGPYQKALKQNNALDFDDILMRVVELFQKHSTILDEYQEKFRYISVDEYQDTNHAQYMIIKMLAEKYRNLCVIGDSDQSIYSWRGANIQNILDFEKDYPDAKVVKLEQNYRSTQNILDCAHSIIVKNNQRKEKKLWTEKDGGSKVRIHVAYNERHEGEIIAQHILEEVKSHEHPDYRDFVVLYRINAQSRVLEEVFMRAGIPYKIVGGIKFYERKEIKDTLAYLRVVQNPNDSVNLRRIINVPPRSIGVRTLERLQTFANIHDCSLFEAMRRVEENQEIPESKRNTVQKFAKEIRKLQKVNSEYSAGGVIKHVLSDTGYKTFLDDGSVEGESRLENVRELISVASKYDKLEPGMSLSIFLEEVSLIADIDTLDEQNNAVILMTLHAAKGLEFPWVFICGLEEGVLPHSRSLLSPEELEEERRLMYVGVTRAMERLNLLFAKSRMLYGEYHNTIPSQFLSDIPPELLDDPTGVFTGGGSPNGRDQRSLKNIGEKPIPVEGSKEFCDGDKVRHKSFGEGIIINIVGGIVTIAFKDPKVGVKKLAVNIAPLEKIGK